MRIGLTIIMPESLEEAIEAYTKDVKRRGYTILGGIRAYWQGMLFQEKLDVFVSADVKKD